MSCILRTPDGKDIYEYSKEFKTIPITIDGNTYKKLTRRLMTAKWSNLLEGDEILKVIEIMIIYMIKEEHDTHELTFDGYEMLSALISRALPQADSLELADDILTSSYFEVLEEVGMFKQYNILSPAIVTDTFITMLVAV